MSPKLLPHLKVESQEVDVDRFVCSKTLAIFKLKRWKLTIRQLDTADGKHRCCCKVLIYAEMAEVQEAQHLDLELNSNRGNLLSSADWHLGQATHCAQSLETMFFSYSICLILTSVL
jgi:hypothetical protein